MYSRPALSVEGKQAKGPRDSVSLVSGAFLILLKAAGILMDLNHVVLFLACFSLKVQVCYVKESPGGHISVDAGDRASS